MEFSSISEAKIHARSWLFESAAVLWSTKGLLPNGMFAEKIDIAGDACSDLPLRLRVQARQIYSFCTLGRMGWTGPWREIASNALDILIRRGIDDGRCIHLFSPDGDVIDRSLDLYDHAFALFALAHASEMLGCQEAADAAAAIRGRLAEWRRPERGYYEGEVTKTPPYRQNPHMHMFEAACAHRRIDSHEDWAVMALDIRELFDTRLKDDRTGAVTEYFDAQWRPLPDESGRIVEPGHCFEWSWLFLDTQDDEDAHVTAGRLATFARKYGICPRRDVAINEVLLDGSVKDADARLWPQTERLKAAIARYQRAPSEEEVSEIVRAYRGLNLYFNTPIRGSWWDRMRPDGVFVAEDAPASSFYHIVCALNELIRL